MSQTVLDVMRSCDSLDGRQQVINAAMKAAPEVSWGGPQALAVAREPRERMDKRGSGGRGVALTGGREVQQVAALHLKWRRCSQWFAALHSRGAYKGLHGLVSTRLLQHVMQHFTASRPMLCLSL